MNTLILTLCLTVGQHGGLHHGCGERGLHEHIALPEIPDLPEQIPTPPDRTPTMTGAPGDVTPLPPSRTPAAGPTGPPTGAPFAQPIPGLPNTAPVTGRRRRAQTYPSWEIWWHLNRDRFLARSFPTERADLTQDAQFLGRGHRLRRGELPVDALREALLPLIASEDVTVRENAVVPFARLVRSPAELERLVALLADDHHHVRERAALGLGITGLAPARPLLESLLLDSPSGRQLVGRTSGVTERTRGYAALGLGLLGGSRSLPHLLKIAQDKDVQAELNAAAISAIGLLGRDAKSAVPALTSYLFNDELSSRARAIIPETLGKIGDPSAWPALAHLARDSRPHRLIRSSAIVGLGSLLRGQANSTATDLLTQIVSTERDPGLRHLALMSLAAIGGDGARDTLLSSFASTDGSETRAWNALALGVLQFDGPPDERVLKALRQAYLDERNNVTRAALVLALGLAGDPKAAPVIQSRIAATSERRLRAYGSLSLGLLDHYPAREVLGESLGMRGEASPRLEAALGLGLLGDPEAVPWVSTQLASSKGDLESGWYAEALGWTGDPKAAPLLIELTRRQSSGNTALVGTALGIARLADVRTGSPLARLTQDSNTEGAFPFLREAVALK